jgi:hypothetical protein
LYSYARSTGGDRKFPAHKTNEPDVNESGETSPHSKASGGLIRLGRPILKMKRPYSSDGSEIPEESLPPRDFTTFPRLQLMRFQSGLTAPDQPYLMGRCAT